MTSIEALERIISHRNAKETEKAIKIIVKDLELLWAFKYKFKDASSYTNWLEIRLNDLDPDALTDIEDIKASKLIREWLDNDK